MERNLLDRALGRVEPTADMSRNWSDGLTIQTVVQREQDSHMKIKKFVYDKSHRATVYGLNANEKQVTQRSTEM